MAARTPPTFLQAGSHTAENTRLALGAGLLSGGIVDPGDMLVAAPGSTMTVTVAAGAVWVLGSRAYQGAYHGVNDASTTLTIAAADATNPRYDRVVAWIQDAAYAGSVNSFSLAVVTGTPAATPLEPAIPADSLELCRITVGAGVTAISSTNLLDRRVRAVLRGAVFSPAVAGDPGQVVKGIAAQVGNLQEWQTSDAVVRSRVNSNGVIVPPGGSSTLAWSKSVQLGSATIAWTQISDKLVSVSGAVACQTADAGNYRLNVTMPGIPTPLSGYNTILQCWITDTNDDNPSMHPLILVGSAWFVDGSSPGFTGPIDLNQVLEISGTYRIAT